MVLTYGEQATGRLRTGAVRIDAARHVGVVCVAHLTNGEAGAQDKDGNELGSGEHG